jgi:hypothetical protein
MPDEPKRISLSGLRWPTAHGRIIFSGMRHRATSTDAAHTNYNIVREHLPAGTMRVLGTAMPVEALPDTPR